MSVGRPTGFYYLCGGGGGSSAQREGSRWERNGVSDGEVVFPTLLGGCRVLSGESKWPAAQRQVKAS